MVCTIYYFPIRGRVEVIKLICAYAKEPFTHVSDFNYADQKSDLDHYYFGQSPRVEIDGLNLVQSNAIVRHLARKHQLYGKGEAEVAMVDMLVDGVDDLRAKYAQLIYGDKLSDEAKKAYWATHGDKAGVGQLNRGAHFEYFARLLRKAGGDYFVGGAVTAADIAIYDIVHLHLRPQLFPDEMKATYPALVAHHDRIEALPGIKEYLAGPDRLAQPNNIPVG